MLIGIWVSKKIMFSPHSIMKMADSVLEYALNTKEGQEKISFIAQYVGKTLAGSAMGSVKGNMPKTKDIIPMLVFGVAQKYFPGLFGQNQPQNEQEQSKSEDQAIQPSKW